MPRRYFAQSLILTSQENARVYSLRSYPTRQDVAKRGIKAMKKSGVVSKWGERMNLIEHVSFFTHPPFHFLMQSGREVYVFMYSRFCFSSQYEEEKRSAAR